MTDGPIKRSKSPKILNAKKRVRQHVGTTDFDRDYGTTGANPSYRSKPTARSSNKKYENQK